MIQIGVTGWGDHPSLLSPHSTAKDKLKDYAAHFPVVELDATFYAIQPEQNIHRWLQQTPSAFQFIVKAHQAITGHDREVHDLTQKKDVIAQFIQSIAPIQEAGKLAMILLQFPPWFHCTKENVAYLRFLHEQFEGIDIAIEFRHQSWYALSYREKMFEFLQTLQFIHTICDEPQAGEGSIPLVPVVTRNDVAFLRFHGRNVYGWQNVTGNQDTWRAVRYLYDYNQSELNEFAQMITSLSEKVENVYVIFNNNSGKHAVPNAKQLQQKLDITYENLASRQMNLFEEEW